MNISVIFLLRFLHHAEDYLAAGVGIPFESNPEAKKKLLNNFLEVSSPKMVSCFEKQIVSNGTGYLVGNDLTAADIFFAVVVDHHCQALGNPLLGNHPNCLKLYNKVKEHPKIAKYQKENPAKGPVKLLQEAQSA